MAMIGSAAVHNKRLKCHVKRTILLVTLCVMVGIKFLVDNELVLPFFLSREESNEVFRPNTTQLVADELPRWLQTYTSWHASERSNIDAKYLVASCVDAHCGGLADRLRNMPFLLLLANRTQRVLLIWWTRPCGLEEFLVPSGLLDWRVSGTAAISKWELLTKARRKGAPWIHGKLSSNQVMNLVENTHASEQIIFCQLSIDHYPYFERQYNSGMNNTTTNNNKRLFGDIFHALFTPSPGVLKLLQSTMSDLGLVENHYVAVHLRARYPALVENYYHATSSTRRSVDADGMLWQGRTKELVINSSMHAIACASQLAPNNNTAVYFASDTNQAIRHVTTTIPRVVGKVTDSERHHLDRNDYRIAGFLWRTPPRAFYNVFVDLLILSKAKCMSIGLGGYGKFAAMMGGDQCTVYHQQIPSTPGDTFSVPCLPKDETGFQREKLALQIADL